MRRDLPPQPTSTPPPPPPPGGVRVTAEQQIRMAALDAAARLLADTELEGGSGVIVRDLEQVVVSMADRFAEWVAYGTYDWTTAGEVPSRG